MNAAPTTAQHRLLHPIRSLNAESTTIGAGMLTELQALATEAQIEGNAERAAQRLADAAGRRRADAPATPGIPAATPAATGNTHLPAALRPYATPLFHAPRTHQHIELHGITVADHTVAMPGWDAAGLPRREVIWLALGLEGQALQAAQALELAEALRLIATAQIQRLQGQTEQEGSAA